MKQSLLIGLLLAIHGVCAQTIADFENFELGLDTFDNGLSGQGGFQSGDVFLPNDYDDSFGAWKGWAISSKQDTLTPGFTNQYSAIDGIGAEGTETYAVGFAFDPVIIHLTSVVGPAIVDGLYITNGTYTYLSLLNGDAFSKRFGGASGDDPDYLVVTFKYYLNGSIGTDSINFYLADFRAQDNSQDYIIDNWTYVDLSSFGVIDSLSCTMASTDIGTFGINTPTFFAIDQVKTTSPTTSLRPVIEATSLIFPNPTTDRIHIKSGVTPSDLWIYGAGGELLNHWQNLGPDPILNLRSYPAGIYHVTYKSGGSRYATKLVKK